MATGEAPEPARPRRLLARIGPRRFAWSVVAAIFIVTMLLSAATMLNYAEVAKAAVLTEVVTEQIADVRSDAAGGVESVVMDLRFSIQNPSDKELKIWILTYKGWVRDVPAEQGLDRTRLSVDGMLYVNGTQQMYFPIFVASYSFDNPELLLQPRGNVTITKQVFMNRSDYPDLMEDFESISDHAAGNGTEVEWLHYSTAIILITDIPPYSGLSHAANVIRRYYGIDITPGSGGAGP